MKTKRQRIALYSEIILRYPRAMNASDHFAWWIVGLVIAALLGHFVLQQFSPEARARRKRRRNYGKVTSRARRPVVTLNARTPKT